MTAQEIFKKLNLKQTAKNSICITYEDIENEERYFSFCLGDRTIGIGSYDIALEEHLAIHKQCQELGWIE